MANIYLRVINLSFSYQSAERELFSALDLTLSRGWTALTGPNGAGKTTLLKLLSGELSPQAGRVERPGEVYYCPQRTDEPPAAFNDLLYAFDGRAGKLISLLGLNYDWPGRWDSLSHGERKRAQIATALWLDPPALAIDEPTNHLDEEARLLIGDALQSFQGIGLLVSHDRELADRLCSRTIFVEPPLLLDRPGGVTRAMEQLEQEELEKRRNYNSTREELKRLSNEARRRKKLAESAKSRVSKKGLDPKDHDGRAKKDLARLSGKDGVGGKLLANMQGRVEQVEAKLEGFTLRRQYKGKIHIKTEQSRKSFLYSNEASTLQFEGGGLLHLPALEIHSTDKIALTGPNGAGKSSLLRAIVGNLTFHPEKLLYLPQEIGARESVKAIEEIKGLPGELLGRLMNIVSRLGSEPRRLLETAEPSPGEMRKLLLALGITRSPYLIIMDEPTNHLDLPSIGSLEELLCDCPCALLLVSHDRRFIEKTTKIEWKIKGEQRERGIFKLHS